MAKKKAKNSKTGGRGEKLAVKSKPPHKPRKKADEVNEPAVAYGHNLIFFNSFEEMNRYDREQMAKLTTLQIFQNLRRLINLAYGMHGYDPSKLPKKHNIKIVPYSPK